MPENYSQNKKHKIKAQNKKHSAFAECRICVAIDASRV